MSITVGNGVTIRLQANERADRAVILDHPDAHPEHRGTEVGRIVEFQGQLGFQSAPFSVIAISPEVLRGIAEIIELERDE